MSSVNLRLNNMSCLHHDIKPFSIGAFGRTVFFFTSTDMKIVPFSRSTVPRIGRKTFLIIELKSLDFILTFARMLVLIMAAGNGLLTVTE